MKEIKRTRTIEEVTGYEAEDGAWFYSKEECEKYEQSALFVLTKAVQEFRIMLTDEDGLFGVGNCDVDIEIFDVPTEKEYELICRYIKLRGSDPKPKLPSTEFIGKQMVVWWDYDNYDAICLDFDSYLEQRRLIFKKWVNDYRESKGINNESTQPV